MKIKKKPASLAVEFGLTIMPVSESECYVVEDLSKVWSVRATITRYQKESGKKFRTETHADGVYIWRLK